MGRGWEYVCVNCGREYYLHLGIGFGFPLAFEDTIEDIKKGKYGREWKDILEAGEYITPDAEEYLFYCNECGSWEVAQDLSLYQPKHIEVFKQIHFGDKTLEGLGKTPYAFGDDLKQKYKLVKKRAHPCLKCKTEMKRFSDSQMDSKAFPVRLKCPHCSTENRPCGYVLCD